VRVITAAGIVVGKGWETAGTSHSTSTIGKGHVIPSKKGIVIVVVVHERVHRVVAQVQLLLEETAKFESIGYAVLPLFTSKEQQQQQQQQQPAFSPNPTRTGTAASRKALQMSASKDNLSNSSNTDTSSVTVNNNCWRGLLRKGVSNPTADPQSLPTDLSAELVTGSLKQAFFLIRIVDTNEFLRANNWKPLIQGLMTLDEIHRLYRDPYDARNDKPLEKLQIETNNNNNNNNMLAAPSSLQSMKSASRPPTNNPLNSVAPGSRSQRAFTPNASNFLSPSIRADKVQTNAAGKLQPLEELEDLENDNNADSNRAEDNKKPVLIPPKRQIASKDYWLLGNPLGPCTEKYQRGDGVDVYIDSARFLPDNTTISRISLRFFTSNKQPMGNAKVYSELSGLTSPAIHPAYNLKAELRGNTMNPSIIGLLRIDTIDSSTLLPGTIGYAVFKVFATRDRKSIGNNNDSNVYINTGGFQLPVYVGRINPDIDSFDENLLTNCDCVKIPCASLLVRIYSAPKSSDGIITLSRDEFPKEEWMKLKLDYPLPDYSTGFYNGSLCEPGNNELLSFEAKTLQTIKTTTAPSSSSASSAGSNINNLSCETAFLQATNANPKATAANLPSKPPSSASIASSKANKTAEQIETEQKYYNACFPPLDNMRNTIDYQFSVPYHIDSGVCINIHSLFNMPDYYADLEAGSGSGGGGGGFFGGKTSNPQDKVEISYVHKGIVSLSPPSLYYQNPPLSDHVYWTKTNDGNKNTRNPTFHEDHLYFYPSEMSFNLYLIVDIRTVRITSGAAKQRNAAAQDSATAAATAGNNNNAKFTLFLERDPVGDPAQPQQAKKAKSTGCKNYWTLLPISCEKYNGNGFYYIASGFYQLPLMEGLFPSSINTGTTTSGGGFLQAINLYEEMLSRVAFAGGQPNLNNFLKLSSDGSSVLLQCYNPLLQDFYKLENNKFPDIFKYALTRPNDLYITKLFQFLTPKNPQGNKDFDEEITSFGQIIGGNNRGKNKFVNPNFRVRAEQFKYTAEKYNGTENGGRLFSKVLPKDFTQIQLMKEINEFFLSSTGLHDY